MMAFQNITITVALGAYPPSLSPYNFSVPELSPAGECYALCYACVLQSNANQPRCVGTFVGNLSGYSLNDYMNRACGRVSLPTVDCVCLFLLLFIRLLFVCSVLYDCTIDLLRSVSI